MNTGFSNYICLDEVPQGAKRAVKMFSFAILFINVFADVFIYIWIFTQTTMFNSKWSGINKDYHQPQKVSSMKEKIILCVW